MLNQNNGISRVETLKKIPEPKNTNHYIKQRNTESHSVFLLQKGVVGGNESEILITKIMLVFLLAFFTSYSPFSDM